MATFKKRTDQFGQTLLLEIEGQVRSAFADHPNWVLDADQKNRMIAGISKRIAGQMVARWDQLSRVRRAMEESKARALDDDGGLATVHVMPSRRLKRRQLRVAAS